MKTARKQILALLALALLLSLCACAQKTQPESNEPKMSTDKVDFPTKADKKTPEKQPEEAISQSDMSNRTSRNEAVDTQPVQYGFSQEAETSLGRLRDRIEFPMTKFGAAYLGYVGAIRTAGGGEKTSGRIGRQRSDDRECAAKAVDTRTECAGDLRMCGKLCPSRGWHRIVCALPAEAGLHGGLPDQQRRGAKGKNH